MKYWFPKKFYRLTLLALLHGLTPPPPLYADTSQPPGDLPKGAIVAFMPDADAKEYSDVTSLKRWLARQGWMLCDGTQGTPDLNYRMLLGTVEPDRAGQNLGARTHNHRFQTQSGPATGQQLSVRGGIGQRRRIPGARHQHDVEAQLDSVEHLPLSTRVLYIMKIR